MIKVKFSSKLFLVTLAFAAFFLQSHSVSAERLRSGRKLEKNKDAFMKHHISKLQNMLKGADHRLDLHLSGEKLLTNEVRLAN